MSDVEEGVCESKMKPCDLLELSDNTSEARCSDQVKFIREAGRYAFTSETTTARIHPEESACGVYKCLSSSDRHSNLVPHSTSVTCVMTPDGSFAPIWALHTPADVKCLSASSCHPITTVHDSALFSYQIMLDVAKHKAPSSGSAMLSFQRNFSVGTLWPFHQKDESHFSFWLPGADGKFCQSRYMAGSAFYKFKSCVCIKIKTFGFMQQFIHLQLHLWLMFWTRVLCRHSLEEASNKFLTQCCHGDVQWLNVCMHLLSRLQFWGILIPFTWINK